MNVIHSIPIPSTAIITPEEDSSSEQQRPLLPLEIEIMEPPQPLTMDRLATRDDLILAQSTSQCCRCCCFQNSINWVLSEQDNFQPGTNPFNLPISGWIHEESSWFGRSCSWILPGCRAAKYVQHAGPPPESIRRENRSCCTCQTGPITQGLDETDRNSNIIGTHEKVCTCGYCFNFGDYSFPICNCFPLPYLETKTAEGAIVGKTLYICDACMFVPKFDVFDKMGEKKYRLRPDTCCLGVCVRCRFGGGKGKCFRVPFIIRDYSSRVPVKTNAPSEESAQIDVLWSGWKNECCTLKNAYHLAFPEGVSPEEKLLLTGAALLVDLTLYEQKDDSDS